MKQTSKDEDKLLADFVGKEVQWDDYRKLWVTEEGIWVPEVDWNQLMLVVDKLRSYHTLDEFLYMLIYTTLDTPIGNFEFIYAKIVTAIKAIKKVENESFQVN